MKAPQFSAYAKNQAAAAALNSLENPASAPAPPALTACPTCGGSGTNHHELHAPGKLIRAGDIHECYHCEGLGYVRPTT